MANYKELEGFGVQTLAADPDTPGWVGSIFYNSTEGVFKVVKPGGVTAGTWSSGGSLNTARTGVGAGATGTQDAALVMGGFSPPGSTTTATESYNGSTWTTLPATLNTARMEGGSTGTTTAAIFFQGRSPSTPYSPGSTLNESYNGTSWTEVNDTSVSTFRVGAAGTFSAALTFGGGPDAVGYRNTTESWNGTSWTSANTLNTTRTAIAGTGTQTAALGIVGEIPTPPYGTTAVESWDGTNWTTITGTNTPSNFRAASGIQTSALTFGGNQPPGSSRLALTEFWNGTSWTELADLSTARTELGGAGTSISALAMAGSTAAPAATAATEEWNAPDLVINTLTTS
jgi:hypothetical protein